jgi:hypothetical protein
VLAPPPCSGRNRSISCSANYHSGISYERATAVLGETRALRSHAPIPILPPQSNGGSVGRLSLHEVYGDIAVIVDEAVRGHVPPPWFWALPGIDRIRAFEQSQLSSPPIVRLLGIRAGHVGPGSGPG